MKRITEWGFNKKIRRVEKDAMLRIERRRSAAGKRTNFRIRGQEVSIAKLRRAAATAEHDLEGNDDADAENFPSRDSREETMSCISYNTPASSGADVDVEPGGEIPPIHTSSWTENPGEQIWKMRSETRKNNDGHQVVNGILPRRLDWSQDFLLPFSSERDVIAAPSIYEIDPDHEALFETESSVSESSEDEDTEVKVLATLPPARSCAPKPFKLRKFLTSTMPSLNYEVRRTNDDLRLGGSVPVNLITGANPDNDNDVAVAPLSQSSSSASAQPSAEDLEHHVNLFQMSLTFDYPDRDRNQAFSDILGVLKAQYDREAATQAQMAMLFDDGSMATEEQAFDKVEALLEQRRRFYGFEDQKTQDACLAGIIFLLDATRIDAEQQTWSQPVVHTRLERVRSLMLRILGVYLHEETTLELLGDEEGKDVDPKGTAADEEGRIKAGRMMSDVVEAARKSHTVLHVLELLPRYHRQWSGWNIQENLSGKKMMFTM